MDTVKSDSDYRCGLVLKGIDVLIRELDEWYMSRASEVVDTVSLTLHKLLQKVRLPRVEIDQSAPGPVIMNEGVERDLKYHDKRAHLTSLRNTFEGARMMLDVPESIRKATLEMFTAIIVREVAHTFPSPIRPHEIDAKVILGTIASLYHYIGAVSALRPPDQPIGKAFPFDF